MRTSLVRLPIAVLLLVIAGLAGASEPPRVVVSIKPVHSLVSGLMQGAGVPTLLVTGGSPLSFRPDEAQRAQLREADLVLWVGPELEAGLKRALAEEAPRGRVLALLDNNHLKVLPGEYGRRDPFFWLDSRNALILIDELTGMLVEMDPDRAHLYRQNRERLRGEVSSLDWELEVGYRALKSGRVYLYDPTQQYFAQAYAMRTAGSVTPRAGAQVEAADLLAARSRLASGEAACLLYESALPHDHLDLLAGTGVRQVAIDSFGSSLAPGEALYPKLMRAHFAAIAGCFGASGAAPATRHGTSAGEEEPVAPGSLGGRYMLLDQDGELVNEKTFRGHYQLIYFGYTFCPDICPTSLSTMSAALIRLGDKAKPIQPVFITVDPERDTPTVLRDYVTYFHPRLVGLTGTPAMIARVAKQYRVRYEKYLPEGTPPERYSMDHTTSLYLLDREGRFVTKFAHGISAAQLAAELEAIVH